MRGYVPLAKDDTGIFDLGVPVGQVDTMVGVLPYMLVRTIAFALNRLDPRPCHHGLHVRRGRDPLLLV